MALERIATLGPSGTCSESVVQRNLCRFGSSAEVVLFPSYEDAIDAVATARAYAAVVAAAYPKLNELVMKIAREVVITDSFVDKTPALVIAAMNDKAFTREQCFKAACVSAPSPLLRELYPFCEIVSASSNSDAARLVVHGLAEAALTTETASTIYNLRVVHNFGDLPMAWVVFQKQIRSDPFASSTRNPEVLPAAR